MNLNGLFFSIHPPPGLLPVLGPLERYMTPTLDAALPPCYVALGWVLIWVMSQIGYMHTHTHTLTHPYCEFDVFTHQATTAGLMLIAF